MTDTTHGIFFRLEAFSIKANSRKTGANNVARVVSEAMRVDGHCSHIANPVAPVIIYGASPLSLVEELTERCARASSTYRHKPSGKYLQRRQRSDCLILVAGVISAPDDWKASENKWNEYKTQSLQSLFDTFGQERVHSVVEHLDERCPHIHFFLVPLDGEDISAVHPGHRAAREIKSSAQRWQRDVAYTKAMEQMLDDFHERVGKRFGLVRKHVNAKRLTRKQLHIRRWYDDQARRRLQNEQHEDVAPSSNGVASVGSKVFPRVTYLPEQQLEGFSMTQIRSKIAPPSPPLAGNITNTYARENSSIGFLITAKKVNLQKILADTPESFDPPPNFEWVRPKGI